MRLLSPKTVDLVFDQQSDGVDLVLGSRSGSGSATAWARRSCPYVPAGRTFFWGGWGGSLVVMDLDRRLTISYMMNRMAPGILGSRPQRGLRPRGLRRAVICAPRRG